MDTCSSRTIATYGYFSKTSLIFFISSSKLKAQTSRISNLLPSSEWNIVEDWDSGVEGSGLASLIIFYTYINFEQKLEDSRHLWRNISRKRSIRNWATSKQMRRWKENKQQAKDEQPTTNIHPCKKQQPAGQQSSQEGIVVISLF